MSHRDSNSSTTVKYMLAFSNDPSNHQVVPTLEHTTAQLVIIVQVLNTTEY